MLAYLACSLLLAADPPTADRHTFYADQVVLLGANSGKADDLQAVLANHPDVQIAEAELRLAQAKLAKAKLLVAQQHSAATSRVEQARRAVERAARGQANTKKLADGKVASADELAAATTALAGAKAALAAAEGDLRAVVAAPPPSISSDVRVEGSVVLNERSFDVRSAINLAAPPPGPEHNELRAALVAPCKLDLPADAKLAAVCDALTAHLVTHGLALRAPHVGPADGIMTGGPFQGERPLGQWLQAVADSFSGRTVPVTTEQTTIPGGRVQSNVSYVSSGRRECFVRDYGVLLTTAENAPAGAETVGQFLARTAKPATGRPGLSPDVQRKVRELLARTVKLSAGASTAQARLDQLADGSGLTIQFPMAQRDGINGEMPGGEKTVAAWLDQLRDSWATGLRDAGSFQFYVREYGLILCLAKDAPPGAVPLTDLK